MSLTQKDLEAIKLLVTEVIDTKLEPIIKRLDSLERRFDSLESRFDNLEGRFDDLESKVDRLEAKLDAHIEESRFEHREIRQLINISISNHSSVSSRLNIIESRVGIKS